MDIISNSVRQTREIASKLAKRIRAGDIIALEGNLGSGKTVFAKGMAEGLGCKKDEVLSPTFVLMRQYKGDITVHHFDLYRLNNIHQLEQMGYEEYFYSDGVTLIEWADKIKEALPQEYLKVKFKVLGPSRRRLEFFPYGQKYADNLRDFKRKTVKISS